jgi:hypothetical protein
MTFSRTLVPHEKKLPFCLREVWVITACLTLVKATAQRFTWRTAPDMEKDFYRLQADLYFYARTKVYVLSSLYQTCKNRVKQFDIYTLESSVCNAEFFSLLSRHMLCGYAVRHMTYGKGINVQFMRLADLIGYGKIIERSPCNRYSTAHKCILLSLIFSDRSRASSLLFLQSTSALFS